LAKQQQKQPEKPRPIMSFGPYPSDRNTSIEASIWKNEIEGDGGTFAVFNVTLKRSYRDDKGDWQQNQNFRPHDLPVAIYALSKAHNYIMDQKSNGSSDE
jgi:hypothetical protein